MNKLQTIFYAITGFKASHIAMGAESEGWEEWDAGTLIDVVDNLELPSIDIEEAEKLHEALTAFKNMDSGRGSDADDIFASLKKA